MMRGGRGRNRGRGRMDMGMDDGHNADMDNGVNSIFKSIKSYGVHINKLKFNTNEEHIVMLTSRRIFHRPIV